MVQEFSQSFLATYGVFRPLYLRRTLDRVLSCSSNRLSSSHVLTDISQRAYLLQCLDHVSSEEQIVERQKVIDLLNSLSDDKKVAKPPS